MIRKNQRLLNIVNCLLDIFLIALAYLLAVWLWLGVYRDNLLNPAVVLLQNGAIFPALLYGVFMAAIYYASSSTAPSGFPPCWTRPSPC